MNVFFIEYLLEEYNTICDTFSADTKKEIDREPVYDKNL